MKKLILFAVVVLCSMTSCSTYNNMVSMDEAVKSAWSNVETQYQRRADLIPNLVSTVKGYASHEESTLQAVMEARSKATSVNISMDDLTPEKIAEFQKAQSAVSSALGRRIGKRPGPEGKPEFPGVAGTVGRYREPHQRCPQGIQRHHSAVQRIGTFIPCQYHCYDIWL